MDEGGLDKVKIGDVKYKTLAAAFAAAQDDDTVTLLVDIAETATMYPEDTRFNHWINKSITIEGNNHTITVAGRGIGVQGSLSDIDVTFKNVTVTNVGNANGRCVDTRGKIASLSFINSTLTTAESSYTGYLQPLTIGGNQLTVATVNVTNSNITVVENANKGYAITTFNPVNMTITGSTIKGWACLNIKGADKSAGSSGSKFNVSGSTFVSANGTPGYSNSYAAIKIEDNNVDVNVTNTEINVNGKDNIQIIASCKNLSQTYTSGCNINLGEGNNVTLEGHYIIASVGEESTFAITGGTFNVDPSAFVATGYAATKSGNVWTVAPISGVAAIGTQGYETLDAAVTAATDGQTVTILQAGNYTIPAITKTLTIEAAVDGVEVEHTTDAAITTIASGKTATFKNITFELGSTVKTAQAHGFGTLYGNNGALEMDGCTVNGALNLFGVSTFTNCTFNASGIYNIWAVNADANFTGCTFINTNRAVNVYDQKHTGIQMNVSFTNCTFSASQKKKAAVNIHHNPPTVGTPANYAVSINNCTTTGTWAGTVAETGEPVGATICNSTLWMISDIENWAEGDITVSVDGVAQDVVAASVGTKYYQTLEEAIEDASGKTVTLLSNIQTTAQIEVDKTMTLDLNGKTIEYTGTSTLTSGVIMVLRGADLTINDSGTTGAIVSGDNAYAAVALTKKDETSTADAQLTVNGGSLTGYYYAVTGNGSRHGTVITVNGGTLVGTNGCAIFHPQNGTLTITGGSLSGSDTGVELRSGTLLIQGGTFSASKTTYACDSNGSGTTTEGAALAIAQHTTNQPIVASISGGTFDATTKLSISNPENNAFDNVQVNGLTALFGDSVVIPEGYLWKDNGNGSSTLVKAVAQIGTEIYATLQEAIDACPANTQTTITVLCNVANGAGFQIPDGTTGKNIIIDFTSHNYTFANTPVGSNQTINQCMHFGVGNTLTLKNGTLNVKEGFTIETSPFKIMMQNYSNLTVENMTVNTSNIPTQTYVGSSYGVWEGRTRPLFNFIKGTSTVTGSTFIFSNTDQFGITCDSPATLTLGEGNVVNGNVTAYDGAIAITGGTYNGTVGVTDVEVNDINGSITITGGTFNVNPSAYVATGYGVTRDGGNYVVAAVNTTWDGSSKAALTDLGNDTYGIYSAAQLAQFSYEVTNNVNNYPGKTVKLMNNIDLNNEAWTPIGLGGSSSDDDYGSESGCFLGIFDGQNKTISNLTATHNNDNRSFVALFGNITLTTAKNVVIKNVNVTNVNIKSNHMAAGILARCQCNAGSITIDHCSVTGGTITSTPFDNGSEMESGNQASGIIGLAQGNNAAGINITNNTVSDITVTATRDLGGLIGCLKLGGTITGNSVSNSTVKQVYPVNYESGKDMSTVKAIIGRTYNSGGTMTNNTDTNVTVTLQN